MSDKPKKLINNDPNAAVTESMEGLTETYSGLLYLDGYPHVGLRAEAAGRTYDKVAVITGGGSGQEPAHAGFVGDGILTAAICGDILNSPQVESILTGIGAATGPIGCLLMLKNCTGDRLNFGLTVEEAKSEGYKAEIAIAGDDCAFPPLSGVAGRRGLAGTILVHKIKVVLRADGAGGTYDNVSVISGVEDFSYLSEQTELQ